MHALFFLFLFILVSIPSVYASTLTATITEAGEVAVPGDEIDQVADFTDQVTTITTEEKTVGGETVELTKELQFVASPNSDVITIQNPTISNIAVKIPDQTKVSAPSNWDNKIVPPVTSSGGGEVPGNFLTPTSSILVGSPDVVLVFDTPVTLVLNGTTGTVAYKIPGATTWIIISGCTGTFAAPNNPPEPGECSISDGTNTKILTYHFTEFTGLSTPAPATSTTSSGNSGGHGNTGVGSPRVFGGSGSSGGGYNPPGVTQQSVFPVWFDSVTDWYREGKISATEFLHAYQWLIENL